MSDKEAIRLLSGMLEKHQLADDEKEAVRMALGALGWFKLFESKLESRRARREKHAT